MYIYIYIYKNVLCTLQSIQIRWNSEITLLERINKQKGPIFHFCITYSDKRIVPLTNEEWILIPKIMQLLKPFDEITKR